jgi:CRISPR-associated protein Cas6
MTTVDLAFPITSATSIPADHGYLLYSAVSKYIPELHQTDGVAIHPIRGRQDGMRGLSLQRWSAVTVRASDDRIGGFLKLAGKSLRIGPAMVVVGVPTVSLVLASPKLRSRLVTTKNGTDPERFLAEVRRQMTTLGISERPGVTVGKRRTTRIKDKEVVGYELTVDQLGEQESLLLQRHGVGGRRVMCCGVFVPES